MGHDPTALTDTQLAQMLYRGEVRSFNTYRSSHPHQFINFGGCHFANVVLSSIDLSATGLRDTVFLNCCLTLADFRDAIAIHATFSTCSLDGADLTGCNLRDAVFNVANLHHAYTYGAINLGWRHRFALLFSRRRWRPPPPETANATA